MPDVDITDDWVENAADNEELVIVRATREYGR